MRTITVKGVGTISAKPDYVIVRLTLESKNPDYSAALERASGAVKAIGEALCGIGFEKDSLKTTDYSVRPEYRNVRGSDGNFRQEFEGYDCRYQLKLGFDFEMKRLAEVLVAVTDTDPKPEISISFTVKDPAAIDSSLLEAAAANAREKAEVLCRASGVGLGSLVSVKYDWNGSQYTSDSRVEGAALMSMNLKRGTTIADIEPDEIKASDSAEFVWEII